MALKLNKFEFPLPKITLCAVWLKLAHFFKSCQYVFSICCYHLPLEKGQGPSFERNLIPLTPRLFCAKCGWNWSGGSGEEVINVFSLCSYYLPLTKLGHDPSLNKLESSSPTNALCQQWWNLTRWFWRS